LTSEWLKACGNVSNDDSSDESSNDGDIIKIADHPNEISLVLSKAMKKYSSAGNSLDLMTEQQHSKSGSRGGTSHETHGSSKHYIEKEKPKTSVAMQPLAVAKKPLPQKETVKPSAGAATTTIIADGTDAADIGSVHAPPVSFHQMMSAAIGVNSHHALQKKKFIRQQPEAADTSTEVEIEVELKVQDCTTVEDIQNDLKSKVTDGKRSDVCWRERPEDFGWMFDAEKKDAEAETKNASSRKMSADLVSTEQECVFEVESQGIGDISTSVETKTASSRNNSADLISTEQEYAFEVESQDIGDSSASAPIAISNGGGEAIPVGSTGQIHRSAETVIGGEQQVHQNEKRGKTANDLDVSTGGVQFQSPKCPTSRNEDNLVSGGWDHLRKRKSTLALSTYFGGVDNGPSVGHAGFDLSKLALETKFSRLASEGGATKPPNARRKWSLAIGHVSSDAKMKAKMVKTPTCMNIAL
jgi:hypothetical protein